MTRQDHIWIKSMEWCKKYCRCHQMPERSFFLKGYQLPLCARCTGIALGHIAAFLAAPFHTFRLSIAILMLPLAVDGTVQHFTAYRSNNFRRGVTGCLYGFAFTSIMLHGLKALLRLFRK